VEKPKVVLIDQDDQPAILQPAQPRSHQAALALAHVMMVDNREIAPSAALIVARQEGQVLLLLGPVAVVVRVDEEEAAGGKGDDVGIFGEPTGMPPNLEHPAVDRPGMELEVGGGRRREIGGQGGGQRRQSEAQGENEAVHRRRSGVEGRPQRSPARF